jgi:alpha-D-xyloside xylohydrolase
MSDRISLEKSGIILRQSDGWLRIEAISDSIVRVSFSKDPKFFSQESLIVQRQRQFTPAIQTGSNSATLSTKRVTARVDLDSGVVTFLDPSGKVLLAEKTRDLVDAEVQGAKTFHVRQQWQGREDESLFGLGENQLGLTNIRGYDLDLWQHNGTVVIPLLVSNRGYGILWDNSSYTRFGDLRAFDAMPVEVLFDAEGKPGGLTASYFTDANFSKLITQRVETKINIERLRSKDVIQTQPDTPLGSLPSHEGSVRWEGSILARQTGDYQFHVFSDGQINIWIDGKMVVDHWRQAWLPWKDLVKVHLEAGKRYSFKVEWSRQGGSNIQVLWKTPSEEAETTSLWSEAGEGIDYYFIAGERIDDVIGGYRQLTGRATMMPIWAMGLWQSRQRYETAQESLDVIAGFRKRGIPFDNIVQDWRYWPEGEWGSHQFDPERFPDPKGWVDEIHRQHARMMISVWGKFYPATDNFKEMQKLGFMYPENMTEHVKDWLGFNYSFFDAFSPAARDLFWKQMRTALFDKGVDGWWLDATEPDVLPRPTLDGQRTHMNPTALGPGSKVLNAYPLMECEAVYEGQRAASPDQRVFILTRSGYAGMQRYSAVNWSGDTTSTWQAMRKQIAAGVGLSISGVPYWTMDVGGFAVPERFNRREPTAEDFEEWCELNTRWFEFGTFCPLLRVHGEFPYREMWEFGGDSSAAYQAQLKFDKLRYRLLPYLYSMCGWVTQKSYTMMRGLAMDFPEDAKACASTDEYMFGPAFLVCPVSEYRARSREVYLPGGTAWFDFWTGKRFDGGQTITAAAEYDSMPVFVRPGSVIPIGPEVQYTTEKSADPVTLRIYPGADGDFELYEDDGVTNGYERGAFSVIPIHWDDANGRLTIGKRQGSFAGMAGDRTFQMEIVGAKMTPGAVTYHGDEIDVPIK